MSGEFVNGFVKDPIILNGVSSTETRKDASPRKKQKTSRRKEKSSQKGDVGH